MCDRNERARLCVRIRKDRRLSPGARLVWQAVAFGFVGGRAYAFPSLDAIAAEAGVSRATAVRAVPELERLGYLEVFRSYVRRQDRRGRMTPRREPNRYVLPLPSHKAHPAPGTKRRSSITSAPQGDPELDALLLRLGKRIEERGTCRSSP